MKTSVKKDGTVTRLDGKGRGPGGRRRDVARVERVEKTWTLYGLTYGKPVLGEGYRSRKAALEDLPARLAAEDAKRDRKRRAERAEDERKRDLARVEAENPDCVKDYADRIRAAAPDGFSVEFHPQVHWYDRTGCGASKFSPDADNEYRRNAHLEDGGTVVLTSEAEVLVWRLSRVDLPDGYGLRHGAVSADGSTFYAETPGSWRTFDRIGVDSSFHSGSLEDPAETVRGEMARIEKSREVGRQMISIPGFGWRVHRDALPKLKEKLARGGSHSFTPSGFGTGYRVSVRRPAGRYGVKQLPADTAAFFGVSVLWAESMDCD